MNTCEMCKHWSRNGHREWGEFKHGDCHAIHSDEASTLTAPDDGKALITYELGDALLFVTHEDFGCVLHERKDKEQ